MTPDVPLMECAPMGLACVLMVSNVNKVMEFNILGISPSGTNVARIHGSEYAAEIIRNFTTDLVSLTEGGENCEMEPR